ncbi:NADH-ubiquinone oxidoreductase [Histoplasma capsulatum]|uniref:NADH-ubiquinone oxidoreductase n=1 Tax=Ajellomyces capsulatus TaxID=5037 RepID=A0A8A1MD60_AJECA|nr:NADH-ubiquinone oxidoreductase 21.3 kDa subunit [Histoplasma mississippiense (nom. inval.)]EDN10998.1 NADH-ubiquinone oxidoreductase 21.3 kDa subunit [Histoplasma mississippiense (nom. inval.)]QSS63861.1 NADH-ubiquinone oxidoreductase [Histoplasma capsulatum]
MPIRCRCYIEMRSTQILRAAKSANTVPINQKYTLQSTGIWERIRRILVVDPSRSNGVPLNPQFRNPTPGALAPQSYDDPVTMPAGDIADNPYWKRDVRRNYARPSVMKQADIVGLLTVGSEAAPKADVLKVGDAGTQQLVEVKQRGEEHGLAAFFEKEKKVDDVLDSQGLPPMAPNLNPKSRYELGSEHGYPSSYPCRTFV